MATSSTGAECVSAPTAMKSTPVAATSRARSRVSPPEASRRARPAVTRTASAICAVRHVVEQDLRGAGVEQLAELVERGHLDLHRQARVARPHRVVRRHHAAGGEHVVVLDQGLVGQGGPVVDAAAAAHGVLLQGPEARAWSCGCRGPAPRCPPARRPSGTVAVATPDRWHRKFSAVRSAVSSAGTGPCTDSSTSPG